MSERPIPFLSLKDASDELETELLAAVRRVISSGHYIGGPEVEAFEQEFAAAVGARHCVGVGNGLDAITLSLLAHGVRPGDKVLVPSNTFIATWLGATHARAVPLPMEPDWRTHLVTPELVQRALVSGVRACLPVHLYGAPVDMPGIQRVCREAGVLVVDDAAQAHGASWGGTPIGGFGNTSTWSFYPGKNLGALGDAGAITTDDAALADQLRALRNYGSSTKYVHPVVGFNSRLDPMQAALLRVKLRHLTEWNARRAAVAAFYLRELVGLGDLQLPVITPGAVPSWHLFVVRTTKREALRAHLDALKIGTIIHYPTPPHLQGAYSSAGLEAGRLTATARAAQEVLSLPIGPHLSLDDAARVAEAVRSFFA